MKRVAAMVIPSLLLAAGPATACGGPGDAFLHTALPSPLPADKIVAEVEFVVSPSSPLGLRARVLRMIQGDNDVSTLIVRSRIWTSCDRPLGNGATGFLIGSPDRTGTGELVVDPDRASIRPPGQDIQGLRLTR